MDSMYNSLSSFYTSAEWRKFRTAFIAERLNRDGIIKSELSGAVILNGYEIILHHKIPLTMANVNDASISLNPNNIMILNAQDHNEMHKRFGHSNQKKVYYVYGSPCSGKTTYVNRIKGNSDLVVDMDNIWQCITGGNRYEKPNALKQQAFAIRDCLYDAVKHRTGNWENAYVIAGGAVKGIREREIEQLGAEEIFIDTDKETCIRRLYDDINRTLEVKEQWRKYIEEWFNSYTA